MIVVKEITWDEFDEIVQSQHANVTIEQTKQWAAYQQTIEGRAPWGCVVLEEDEHPLAVASLIDFKTHGYHYMVSHHGPLWFEEPDVERELAGINALASFVKARDKKQVFMRLAVWHELETSCPVLSTIPYDATVVLDITGGDDAILARMKPRGRRDVRKALREAPITCADETTQALESFDEYYEVMLETGRRDGFTPAPKESFERMMRILGEDHCRLYAGRLEDGTVCTWSMCTISGTHAMRYYAGSKSETMRMHVSDKLCYFEACELGKRGCVDYDLMAIGSDFSPTLMGLNEFKTKFSKEVVRVAPDRDVPLKKNTYRLLQTVKKARG